MSATRLAAWLTGRRAFITGGGSGIGLLDREPARLAAAAATLGAAGARAVLPFAADVTDEAAYGAAIGAFVAAP